MEVAIVQRANRITVSVTRQGEAREKMKLLRGFLGVEECLGENYSKVEGSCQWIDGRDDFQDWRDRTSGYLDDDDTETTGKTLSIFWIHANPGAGKTVLASHVISQLQELQLECAFYYFHAGDKTLNSTSALLRSIAHQMAESNSVIRDKLFQLRQEGLRFDMDDSRSIWTKIFSMAILQVIVLPPFTMTCFIICINSRPKGSSLYATVLGH